jgi:serine/threonine-protein kinase PRP4
MGHRILHLSLHPFLGFPVFVSARHTFSLSLFFGFKLTLVYIAGPSTPAKQPSRSPSPGQEQEQEQFTLAKPDSPGKASTAQKSQVQPQPNSPQDEEDGQAQVNAADYDPSLDRREDEIRRVGGAMPAPSLAVGDEEDEEEEDEEDEVDDMFAFAGAKTKKKTGKKKAKSGKPVVSLQQQQQLHSDTAADPEGYYTVILGEVLVAPPTPAGEKGERYQVYASIGRGMFAVVVRARVLPEGEDGKETKEGGREVAIKIVRAQEVMCVISLYRLLDIY